MNTIYDVAIIGTGVIGALTARELSRYQLRVVLLEKADDVSMGASKANSGIVHAGFDALPGTLKARFNVRGNQMMDTVASELDVPFTRNGSLVLAFSEEEKETLSVLYERGVANGVPDLRILNHDETLAEDPAISDSVVASLSAPTGGIISPYELAIAACGNAMDNGCDLRLNFEVTSIERQGHGYEIRSGDDYVHATFVINAAGVQSDRIARMIGDQSFTITPRKGEYLLCDKEVGSTCRHTLFRVPSKMGKGILVSPTVHGNLLLGPTSENIEDGSDTATTAAGIAKISSSVSETLRNAPLRSVITSFTGIRSVPSTEDFILTSPRRGFLNAAGIESPGLTSSPAIAEYLVECLHEQGLELVPDPSFQPRRVSPVFDQSLPLAEKNALIAKCPEYGHYICRCEKINEGEIRTAIRQNPPARNLDAVKRRTRAGMGRCQGGFCSPAIVKILSEEFGLPYEDVTKSGDGSYINCERSK